MRLTSARLHVGAILLFALVPTFRRANVYQDPVAVLDRASRSYDTVRTLTADFTQVIDNPMLGDPDTTRGRLYQRRPNFFAMRFTEPKNDRVVADGRRLWLYTPSTTPGQVIRTTIPGTGTDRKSTRLNSSHGYISYAVFCLKKKKKIPQSVNLHLTYCALVFKNRVPLL